VSDASWWERKTFQFFMCHGPLVAAAVPVVAGLVFLYAAALAAALIAEHRIWTTSLEVTAVLLGGAGALVITYLLGILALGAVFTRSRYNRLLTLHQTMRDIREMSWVEFEQLVAANYLSQGYEVDHVGKVGPDAGVDLEMRKDGETVLVQCKHYRNSWVYLLPLRQFLGTLEHFKADRGRVGAKRSNLKVAVCRIGRPPVPRRPVGARQRTSVGAVRQSLCRTPRGQISQRAHRLDSPKRRLTRSL
jgi:hypothetical protein